MLNRWLRTTIRFTSITVVGLLIAACGGGGGGTGGGGFLGNEGANQIDAVIAIAATNAAGDVDNQLSNTNPLTIEVSLQRSNGDPIANAVVELGATIGTVSPDNGSALTDANGVAVFEVTFDGTEGAGTLTATYTESAQSVDVSLSIQAAAGPPAYLLDLATTDPSGNVTQRFSSTDPLTVTITLFSVEGIIKTPVSNEIITLGSSIGTVDPSNGSALTDDSGQVTFLIEAQSDLGAGVITATYAPSTDAADTASEVFSRSLNIEAKAADSTIGSFILDLELLDAAGNTTTEIAAEAPVTARVTLTTTSDKAAVELRIINLTSDIATVEPANGSTLTNAAGVAEFTLTAGSTLGAGTVTASFANDNASLIETAVLESVSAESDTALAIVTLDADGNASNILKQDNPLTVRVSLVDFDGEVQNVADEIINLTTDLGSVTPSNGSALTDNGVAEFTLEFNGTVGAGTVTATYATAQGDLQLTENLEAQTDAESLYVLSMSRSTGSLTPSNPVTVTVNLRSGSASGPAVAGELVSLTSQISDITPSNGSAITDASGNATFTLQYSGINGAGAVTAGYTSAEGNTFSNSLNVTSSQGAPLYGLDITSPASGSNFDEDGVDVVVKLTASATSSVRAQLIALATTVGSISPSNGQALTDSDGNANFQIIGDGTTGAGLLTATFTDTDGNIYEDVTSVSMEAKDLPENKLRLLFVSAAPTTIAIKGSGGGAGTQETSIVSYQVLDSEGAGVAGAAVQFTLTTDLGGVALETATDTTDAQGIVRAVVESGTLPTPVRVKACLTNDCNDPSYPLVLSDTLTIAVGVPVASRYNIYKSPTIPCTGATDTAGTVCTLEIAAFDRTGNPVVDGTVANVVSSCGGVGQSGDDGSTGSCVFGAESFGRCIVEWVAPENMVSPTECPDNSAVRVLAYTLGEEDFIDKNGDGYFTSDKIDPDKHEFQPDKDDKGEAFLDLNDDDKLEAPESFFVDWNNSGMREPNTGLKSDPLSTLYNGTACETTGTTCSKDLIYVYDVADPTQ
ncbi:beta strand repeat-containing protein [Luminiphilus sp. nBUS_07]|uniref:beta strand repeat-containing protein n=1 Tax=Luminiphilus sp. nBUS_07 TaxID=3395314 RepID=UPI003EBC9985